ncbi:MAG: DUF2726 domain-containing protein [Clostridiales bacterium]|jgi:hypothetical protein|nr:DUF2726 domain-containing protein [Clostridiales bacterium]
MKGFTNNFGEYFLPITIIFLICYIFYKIYKWLKPTPFPYVKKTLLSKNELSFYKKLKPISEKYGMHILCKIRMADIVEVKKGLRREEWSKYFNKIKSKHVDFALADPDTMEIAVLIELDDKSHIQKNRAERDNFVDKVYSVTNIPIIHTYGNDMKTVEELILTVLETS